MAYSKDTKKWDLTNSNLTQWKSVIENGNDQIFMKIGQTLNFGHFWLYQKSWTPQKYTKNWYLVKTDPTTWKSMVENGSDQIFMKIGQTSFFCQKRPPKV